LEKYLDLEFLQARLTEWSGWAQDNLFVLSAAIQFAVVLFAFVIAWAFSPRCRKWMETSYDAPWYQRFVKPVTEALVPLALPVVWLVAQWFSVVAAQYAKWPHHLIEIAVSLLTAWVVIRLATVLIRDRTWSKVIAVTAWTVAALNITALLDPTIAVLDSMALQFGSFRISVLGVAKAVIAVGVLVWLAGVVSGLVERRIAAMPKVSPAAAVLLGKLFRIVVYTLAVVMGLDAVGIDLTAFAVFSGAVGLGIGFGLQKVFSNLISGLILLMDRSVKPGDVIAIGDSYGWINSLGARCVSVITRDGIEHLIPNEELISQRVENWSYTNNLVRLKLPIGVDYDSDVRKAIALSVEAAGKVSRVLAHPPPVCQMRGFGDNSVDLELRVWLNDPQSGIGNLSSEILLNVWDAFHENGIDFPYPQRDIHLRSLPPEVMAAMGVAYTEDTATDDDADGGAPEGASVPRTVDGVAPPSGSG
jgi:small-conductance mechanosensitive channel